MKKYVCEEVCDWIFAMRVCDCFEYRLKTTKFAESERERGKEREME